MAQLKDTIIMGDASVTGTLYSSKIQGNTLWIPTAAGGTTYGAGTSGQVLKTNGTTIYWANDTNSDTTYTFAGGTNSFTVTPAGGSAQTVTITPSITNNITGSGTSGYLVKFNGANTITNGPQLGSSTTTFLRNDGSWATPTNTTYSAGTGLSLSSTTFSVKLGYTTSGNNRAVQADSNGNLYVVQKDDNTSYTLPTATNTTLGGVKPWYSHTAASTGPTTGNNSTAVTVNAITTTSGKYYAVEADSNGRLFVNVPWTDNTNTTYTLTNALSSHKFTWTFTAGGSGSDSTTTTAELVAGTGITLTDDTTNKKITIASSVSNTDEKLKTEALTSGTTYYPILANGANAAASRQVDSTLGGLKYISTAGTTSAVGTAILILGNSTTSGTANNEQGVIRFYGTTQYYTDLKVENGLPANNRTIYLPSYAGTMYLTCTSTTDAVGGATTAPVYVTNTGQIAAVTSIPYTLLSGTPTIPTKTSQLTNDSNFITTDTNTTYSLSGTLSTHKFTSTLTPSSGSATTSDFTLAAGTGITITDTASSRTMTIACSVTNTDTKLQVAEVTSGTQYYPLVGTGTTAATRQYDTTGFKYKGTNGTTSAVGSSILELGNSTGSGTANNKQAQLIMYGSNTKKATITLAAPSADIALALPTSGGTLALTTDIPDMSSKIDTAGTGLSKSETTLNHSNSVTAKTTQALYPITFDAQGHITGAGTAVTPLTSHQTIKQDGVTGATVNRFGTCSTAAATAAKTVSITTGTFALEAGSMVTVKFSNANTANSPTLNVGSSGAKNIFHRGAQIASGANKALLSGVVLFVYDGTQWHLIDGNYAVANTTSVGSASAGTAISADDITAWTTNTPTSVTKKTVVTSASGATSSYSEGIITFTDGSFSTGDSVTVTAGTAASLSYTSRSIPNISVTSTTVANGVTLS